MLRKCLSLIFFFALLHCIGSNVYAQDNQSSSSFGVVSTLSINDKDAKEGDIIILSGKELAVSSRPYQNVMVGVVSPKPAFSIKPTSDPLNLNGGSGSNSITVITSGNVLVTVNLKNGEIKKGDQITTSDVKGIGMKAVKTGYVLGSALEDFSSKNKDDTKKILVALNVHYASNGNSITTRIGDIFKLAALAAYENPRLALKYAAIILLVMFSILFTFLTYGKIARLGIIAMGRNPLASKKIYKSIILNSLFSIAVIAGGLVAAFVLTKINF